MGLPPTQVKIFKQQKQCITWVQGKQGKRKTEEELAIDYPRRPARIGTDAGECLQRVDHFQVAFGLICVFCVTKAALKVRKRS